MTAKVPNLTSALGEVRKDASGKLKCYIINPWNNFFQSFTQNAPAAQQVALTGSPFSYTANAPGTLYITGGTVSSVVLTRGTAVMNLTTQRQIPIGIGDTVVVTYTVAPNIQFWGA